MGFADFLNSKKIMKALGCTREYADQLLNTVAVYGISLEDYMGHEIYKMPDSEKLPYIYRKLNKDIYKDYTSYDKPKNLKKYSRMLAEDTGISVEECSALIETAYRKFRITPREYYERKLYGKDDTRTARRGMQLHRKKSLQAESLSLISEITGCSSKEIREHIKEINKAFDNYRLTIDDYICFGFYELIPYCDNAAAVSDKIGIMQQLDSLAEKVITAGNAAEAGESSYAEVKDVYDSYLALLKRVFTQLAAERMLFDMKYNWPEIPADDLETAADMYAMERIFNYGYTEYVAYHFIEKTMEQRLAYYPDRNKARGLAGVNMPEHKAILDSKYDTYCAYRDYYGREMRMISSVDDLPVFVDFALRKKTFVKKDNYDAFGRGVQKITVTEDSDLGQIFRNITEKSDVVLLEELIVPHESIRTLNPDSVNTVRVVTVSDGKKVDVAYTFIKVGRAGSFVDNGGSGGIFVHIDKNTGTFDSNGIDEHGIIYETHPDHGYEFVGIRLPDWEKLIPKALEMCAAIPELRYVGWDFTYTEDEEWIAVEGNSLSQFVAQQSTLCRGLKSEIKEMMSRIAR